MQPGRRVGRGAAAAGQDSDDPLLHLEHNVGPGNHVLPVGGDPRTGQAVRIPAAYGVDVSMIRITGRTGNMHQPFGSVLSGGNGAGRGAGGTT